MNPVRALRLASWAEGLSLLALSFIAMPLKYLLGLPLAVRVAGSLHGALFLVLLTSCLRVAIERALPATRVVRVLGWSLVPFGCLRADRELRRALRAGPGTSA